MSVEFDYSKLRGRIKEILGTETEFAKRLNLSTVSVSARLNNKVGFSEKEILSCCEILKIPVKSVIEYFFIQKLKKT